MFFPILLNLIKKRCIIDNKKNWKCFWHKFFWACSVNFAKIWAFWQIRTQEKFANLIAYIRFFKISDSNVFSNTIWQFWITFNLYLAQTTYCIVFYIVQISNFVETCWNIKYYRKRCLYDVHSFFSNLVNNVMFTEM